jgi:hypothetical protein
MPAMKKPSGPTHTGIMVELLQRTTRMPVVQVKDRQKVAPVRAYVIPPNKDMSILHGVLHLLEPGAPRGLRRFFVQDEHGWRAGKEIREEVQTCREEMQTSQEELKSTTEELQSTNTDIATDLGYPGLSADVRQVLRTLVFMEKQVGTRDGRWFLMRIMPYRTLANRIDGVVITFSDITAAKALETQLRKTLAETEKPPKVETS